MATNQKLKQRSRNILRRASSICSDMTDKWLDDLLARCNGSVKLSLVVAEKGVSVDEGRRRLETAQGLLAKALAIDYNNQQKSSPSGECDSTLPVLCVDGGGSKCAAMVGLPNQQAIGKGQGGPCNLYAMFNILPSFF